MIFLMFIDFMLTRTCSTYYEKLEFVRKVLMVNLIITYYHDLYKKHYCKHISTNGLEVFVFLKKNFNKTN